uniref:Uncharacterized protein n=1 Tax=Wuchereria bancrofti TaxID=6293 RepID=A0A1I8EQ29_WUCBA
MSLSEVIDNLGLELNSQNNNGVFVTDDSDSGNYSPTYSTSNLETKFTATPNPSRLVPAQIPLQQSQSAANQDKQRIYHRNMKGQHLQAFLLKM